MMIQTEDGTFTIQGNVTVDTVNHLWQKSLILFANVSSVCINFAQVKQVDSAGTALLIAWTRLSQQQQKKISFIQLPHQMQMILRVSGLEKILPVVNDNV